LPVHHDPPTSSPHAGLLARSARLGPLDAARLSLVSSSGQLLQSALEARHLFARAQAAAPLAPGLGPLLLLAGAARLLAGQGLALVIRGTGPEDLLLQLVAGALSLRAFDVNRVHHQAAAGGHTLERTQRRQTHVSQDGDALRPR